MATAQTPDPPPPPAHDPAGSAPAGEHAAAQRLSLVETLRLLARASRGYLLVNWVNFGDGIAYFGFLALMTLFLRVDVGFTTQTASVAVSLFTAGVTVAMALGGGTVSDRLGARRAISVALLVVLAGRVLLTLCPQLGPGPPAMLGAAIALLIMAFGEGVIQPALYAGVKEYTDPRTVTMGYAFLYAIMNLGIVAGEALSPLVREQYARQVQGIEVSQQPSAGIAGAFWIFTAVTAVLLLSNLLLFSRQVEARDRVAPATVPPAEHARLRDRLRALPILDARFIFFIFILLPVRTLFAHQWLTMPDYVTRAFPAEVGSRWEWINGLNPLVIVVGVPLIAALTRGRRILDMMIVGTAISAVTTFLLVPGPNLTLLLTYTVIFSVGEAVWSSRFLEYVADLAPAHRVGVYMGVANIPWFLAKSVTGLYAGSMIERYLPETGPQDPGTMWLLYGLIGLASPIGLLLMRRRLARVPARVGTPAL